MTRVKSDVQYEVFYTSKRGITVQTKLTLRLDDRLVKQAKAYAKKSGKSVSQLVAEYFSLLNGKPPSKSELTASVRRLKGALKTSQVSVQDYHKYLEEKYL